MEQHFPGVVERLNEGIDRFSQAEQLYRKEADRQLRKLKQQRGPDVYIPVRLLEKLPARDALCYELFREYGFSSAQMPQLTELAGSESGRYLTSDTHRVIKDRDFLIITSLQGDQTEFLTIEQVPAELSAGLQTFRFTEAERPAVIPAEQSTAWIDAAQLRFPLILRRWRTGDYFYPLGMGMKKKKLSRYFIDQKIPAQEKERIWVLESDKRVVWVAGHRLDERFKIGPATRKVLKVELRMP